MLVERETRRDAKVYCIRFAGPLAGWVNFTVCDATGELNIQSDWGNWAHRWNINNLGVPTLSEFLAQPSFDYVARKLLGQRVDYKDYEYKVLAKDLLPHLSRMLRGELSASNPSAETSL